MEKYSRPSNCEKLIGPRVNAKIWDKLDNKTKHNDLRASSTQKIVAKIGSILTFTTDKLLQMRNAASPDIDQLITMNTDAFVLLGHTMCELCISRRDAIRSNLSKDYSNLCASNVPTTTYLFEITSKHNSMIFELPTRLAKQQCLKGLIKPDLIASLILTVQTIRAPRERTFFYPTVSRGRNTHQWIFHPKQQSQQQ